MNHSEFEAELRRDGFKVIYGGIKPGTTNPDHSHTFDARVLVLGGEIAVTRNGQIFRAGEFFYIPAGTIHAEQVGSTGVAYLAGHRGPGA